MCAPELGALEDLPAQEEGEEDRDIDVRDQEVRRTPLAGEEDLETVDEDEEGRPEEAPDSETGLKGAVVNELRAVDALHTVASPYIGHE